MLSKLRTSTGRQRYWPIAVVAVLALAVGMRAFGPESHNHKQLPSYRLVSTAATDQRGAPLARAAGATESSGEAHRQQTGGTWRELFSRNGSGPLGVPAAVMWLLALEACGLLCVPCACRALRALPDRGYALTKPLGVLAVAYPVWLGASIGIWSFSATALLVCGAALLTISGLTAMRARVAVADYLRARWRHVLAVELLFVGTFLSFYALRTGNPDLFHPTHGGEKFKEMAHLTAVMKSSSMPPYDPWLAGGSLNYYYFGHVLVATVAKPLRVPPEIAFNLAIATFAAFLVVATYSLGRNLAVLTIRHLQAFVPARVRQPQRAPALAGLSAVALVLVLGNLDGAVEWVEHVQHLDTWHALPWSGPIGSVLSFLGGMWNITVHSAHLAQFDYWRPSRVIQHSASITEFPAFTFLFADLHAHLMALPYAIVATSASLAILLGASARERLSAAIPTLLLAGLLLGMLYATNTWDLPTQALIALLAVFVGTRLAVGRSTLRSLAASGARLVVVVGAGWLAFLPFVSRFQSFSELTCTVERTPVGSLAVHFGLLLVLCVALVRIARTESGPRGPQRLDILVVAIIVAGFALGRSVLAIAMALGTLIFAAAIRVGRGDRDPGLLASLGLALTGLGLIAGVELVEVQPDVGGMNTIFKFWLQAWWLLAIAGGYAAWRGLTASASAGLLRRTWTALVLAGASAALVYPVLAIPARLAERIVDTPPTPNGMAFMAHAQYTDDHGTYALGRDLTLINWARRHIDGSPVIIEANTPIYRWGGRFSVFTGLPTVLGWDYQEKQQRFTDQGEIDARRSDIHDFYSTPDPEWALAILRRYGVRYVFVGGLERAYYPTTGLAKLKRVPGLRLVLGGDDGQIYELESGLSTRRG